MTEFPFASGLKVFVIAAAIAGGIFWWTNSAPNLSLIDPQGNAYRLKVAIADTPALQEQGLMGRTDVGDGMLFVFPDEEPLIFWMKNTLVPLDIFFFDRQEKFVSKQHMIPCEKDPCQTYNSMLPAQYALEVAAGNFPKTGSGWSLKR